MLPSSDHKCKFRHPQSTTADSFSQQTPKLLPIKQIQLSSHHLCRSRHLQSTNADSISLSQQVQSALSLLNSNLVIISPPMYISSFSVAKCTFRHS
ncbi:hypothetical protein PoB_007594100 [Plakobranchus ocellatus]|uniref:Uncharacterized protein n=1 Tax=Plakobranchus ocellatus TaxID=259542 RepID=A0AAV4E008_9GAST|nr:hypothetical protein PoB_007594100 [Plakobranchus ocellatus]